jgi:hypothetical protein
VLFVILSGAQSIAGIVVDTKSITGEPPTFAVALTDPTPTSIRHFGARAATDLEVSRSYALLR